MYNPNWQIKTSNYKDHLRQSVEFARGVQAESDAMREQLWGNVGEMAGRLPGYASNAFRSTGDFIRGAEAEADVMREQLWGNVGEMSGRLPGYASNAFRSTGDFIRGTEAEADVMREQMWQKIGKTAAEGVKFAQDQFSRGTDWSNAKYMANESMIHFAAVTGLLSLTSLSSFFFGRYLKRKYNIPSARSVIQARFALKNNKYHVVAELDDGSTVSREVENPDTLLRTAANENALNIDQPPLDKPEVKLAVISKSSGEIVDAVLEGKPAVVKEAVREIIEFPDVSASTLASLFVAKDNETVTVTIRRPPITLGLVNKQNRSTNGRKDSSIAMHNTNLENLIVNRIMDKVKEARSEVVSETLSDVSPQTQREAVELMQNGNPAEIKEVLVSDSPTAKQVSKVLETIAVLPEADNVKHADPVDVQTAISQLPSDIQDEIVEIIQNSAPITIAKILTEPNLNHVEQEIQQALQALALIPVAVNVKDVRPETATAVLNQYDLPVQQEVTTLLQQASPLEIALTMVTPPENNFHAELVSAVLGIATEMNKITTRLPVKEVKEAINTIANMQVAQNAVQAPTELVQIVLVNKPIEIQEQVAQIIQTSSPAQIAQILAKPETNTVQTEIKKAIQEITTQVVIPAVAEEKAEKAKEIAKETEDIIAVTPVRLYNLRNRKKTSTGRRRRSSSRRRCPNGSRRVSVKVRGRNGRRRSVSRCRRYSRSRSRSCSR